MQIKFRPLPQLTEEEIAWIWSMIDSSGGPDACWPWKGNRHKRGYGQFTLARIKKRMFRVGRVILMLETGIDPAEKEACHSCDNPPCCNPLHVSAGTHAENMHDMSKKGRQSGPRGEAHHHYGRPDLTPRQLKSRPDVWGEGHPMAKLTNSSTLEIREAWRAGGISKMELSRRFQVSHKLIRNVIAGVVWKHI